MRLNPSGEIVRCSYDFDSGCIGYIKVSLPIVFSEPFLSSASQWTRHELWKALIAVDEALAVMIVNNVFLVTVTKESLIIQSKADRAKPQVAVADSKLLFNPLRPIGFVRTCPEIKDVNVPPYKLFMDDRNRVSLGGGEFQTLSDAVISTDIQLYKSLITTNRPAVYMSVTGPKYL